MFNDMVPDYALGVFLSSFENFFEKLRADPKFPVITHRPS